MKVEPENSGLSGESELSKEKCRILRRGKRVHRQLIDWVID